MIREPNDIHGQYIDRQEIIVPQAMLRGHNVTKATEHRSKSYLPEYPDGGRIVESKSRPIRREKL